MVMCSTLNSSSKQILNQMSLVDIIFNLNPEQQQQQQQHGV